MRFVFIILFLCFGLTTCGDGKSGDLSITITPPIPLVARTPVPAPDGGSYQAPFTGLRITVLNSASGTTTYVLQGVKVVVSDFEDPTKNKEFAFSVTDFHDIEEAQGARYLLNSGARLGGTKDVFLDGLPSLGDNNFRYKIEISFEGYKGTINRIIGRVSHKETFFTQ